LILPTILSEFLPLLFYSLFYKKLTNKALKVFFYYTLGLALFNIISSFVAFKFPALKFQAVKTFSIFEVLTVGLFFLAYFKKRYLRLGLYCGAVVFFIFFLFDFLPVGKSPFYSIIFEILFFLIVIILFLFRRMQEVVAIPISSTISFWIAVGLFVYFSGILFNVLFSKMDLGAEARSQRLLIYMIVTITKNILLCLALLGSEKNEITDENIPFPNDEGFQKLDISNN